MADYPAFGQVIGTTPEYEDDIVVDRAVSGGAHGRAFYTGAKRAFTVVHMLNAADLATWEAFYAANRLLAVNFTWLKTNTAYTCLFAGPPKFDPGKPPLTQVSVKLREQ
jgi:hypothetical protein